MKPTVSIRKALADKGLLGKVLDGDTWHTWRTLLIAAMGEALTDAERPTFTALTGRLPIYRAPQRSVQAATPNP